jgi:biopolymer transport protein ExbB/TolQ
MALLKGLQPKAVLISRGHGNSFGHPHPTVVARYRKRGIKIHDSAQQGAIHLQLGRFEPARSMRQDRRFWRDPPLVKSGGWMMLPIILSSIAAMAIVAERLWTLRASRVTPEHLLGQVWVWIKDKQLNKEKLKELRASSPLGEILAAGLANSKHGREIMKECIEEAAARVIHELERYINALGTIAAMAPLLGLLGTVLGMIDIFSAFMGTGMTTNASVLAGGISKALITTAAGLMVGIPSVFFHRFLQRRIDELVVGMEQEAIKLVEVVQGDRDVDLAGSKA